MTRKERKTAIENMAEDFMNLGNKGKTMVVLMQTAYNEGKTAGKREECAKWERKPAQGGGDGFSNKKIGEYIKQKGFNLSEISRKTGITYMSLYNSFLNEKRERDLKVDEFLLLCKFLELDSMTFCPDEQKEKGQMGFKDISFYVTIVIVIGNAIEILYKLTKIKGEEPLHKIYREILLQKLMLWFVLIPILLGKINIFLWRQSVQSLKTYHQYVQETWFAYGSFLTFDVDIGRWLYQKYNHVWLCR